MNDKELSRNIADNIRIYRIKKRISQDDLSEISGVSQQYICKIENEKVNPSISVILQLANALGVTVNDLVYKKSF